MSWQYTDASNTVVFRINQDGGMESMLATALTPGTAIEPAPVPEPVIPQYVTMRQARLLMHCTEYSPGVTLLQAVEAAIEAMPEPPRVAARIEWDYSNELLRNNVFVGQLTELLGLSSEQVDAMFIAAATL